MQLFVSALLLSNLVSAAPKGDAVTDWNARSCAIVAAAKPPAPAAYRALAVVQTSVWKAVEACDASHASARDAAVAAASRAALLELFPEQREAIEREYGLSPGSIDAAARDEGSRIGVAAAADVLQKSRADGASAAPRDRPETAPGRWVATTLPAVPQWPSRTPWVLDRADLLRPGPPPALASELWARDLEEVRVLGARDGSRRSAEQTAIARFWETTMPSIYFELVRSLAEQAGRDVARNARLYAAAAQAMDDALIAAFDAKYHYRFWRPVTAIRNGDRDENDATACDLAWAPLIETPMHPEYPAAHSSLAGAVGAVLAAELGAGAMPELSSSSPTAGGEVRRWSSIDALVEEVGNARVYAGVHFRNSTRVGTELGSEVGKRVAAKFFATAQ
jgi:hypothetical protein